MNSKTLQLPPTTNPSVQILPVSCPIYTYMCQIWSYTETSQYPLSVNWPFGRSTLRVNMTTLNSPEDVSGLGNLSLHDAVIYGNPSTKLLRPRLSTLMDGHHPLYTFFKPDIRTLTITFPTDPPKHLKREWSRDLLLIDLLQISSHHWFPRLLTPSFLQTSN